MDNYRTAHSEQPDAAEAVKSIREQMSGFDARFVLYFASSAYPAETVSSAMAGAFPGITTAGCTTAGEMITNAMGHNSIVAMAFHRNSLKDLKIEILQNITTDTEAVAKAFRSFEQSLGEPMHNLDPERYVGVVIIDGMSGCEERINDQIGNHTNVHFVGGSAADDFKFEKTYVFANGKAYSNAALLLLLEPVGEHAILKTQSFTMTDKKLTPTLVDESRRMVLEFNGKPAAEEYARTVGLTVAELAPRLNDYMMGLVFDEQNYFVRSAKAIEGDHVSFHCAVKKGLELTILRQSDVVEGTRADLCKYGKIQAAIDFNCGFRLLELTGKNQLDEYARLFRNTIAIGFATYGESYIGHMNMTSTMLLLK